MAVIKITEKGFTVITLLRNWVFLFYKCLLVNALDVNVIKCKWFIDLIGSITIMWQKCDKTPGEKKKKLAIHIF